MTVPDPTPPASSDPPRPPAGLGAWGLGTAPPAATDRPRKLQDFAFEGDWDGYFELSRNKGPRATLLHALELFDKQPGADVPRLAIDLACGEGRDTLELVRRGWRVVAIDQSRRGIDMLLDQLDVDHAVRVSPQIASFADARLVPCDLLNSSFAIPFCPRDQFDDLWRRIVSSIKPGGRFAGQLFGERDSWGRCGLTIPHARAQVDHLFKDFTFERLEEDEKDDLAGQRPKHWHVFHIVARKMVP